MIIAFNDLTSCNRQKKSCVNLSNIVRGCEDFTYLCISNFKT